MNDQSKSEFDRLMGALDGVPDSTRTKESVVRYTPTWGVGSGTSTYIVQTIRRKEEGDYVFVECVRDGETVRLPLPPEVSEVIARQRDSLTTTNRRLGAKAAAAVRKARGDVPFQKRGGGK